MGKCMKDKHITISGDFGPDRRFDQLKKWVQNGGGKLSTTLSNDTTHLVVHKDHWRRQTQIVQQALQRKDIKIVSFDWLDDSLMAQRKKRETAYLWSNIDKDAIKQRKLKERLQARQQKEAEKAEKKPGNQLMAALYDHTEEYFGPEHHLGIKERARLQRQKEKEELAAMQQKQIEKQLGKKKNRDGKAAREFKKGVKNAKNDIFSENHHVYMDSTGLKYDIVLTKVDTRTNRNERVQLTIYESNADPHTFATHVKASGTGKQTQNLTPVPMGSNYATAFRSFRTEFQNRTHVAWDMRFAVFEKPRVRDISVGTTADTAIDGINDGPKDETPEQKEKRIQQEWVNMPFTYTPPPSKAPRGEMPDGSHSLQQEEANEARSVEAQGSQEIEAQDIEAQGQESHLVTGEDMAGDEYMMSGGAGPGLDLVNYQTGMKTGMQDQIPELQDQQQQQQQPDAVPQAPAGHTFTDGFLEPYPDFKDVTNWDLVDLSLKTEELPADLSLLFPELAEGGIQDGGEYPANDQGEATWAENFMGGMTGAAGVDEDVE